MKVATDLVICRGKKFLFIRRKNEPFKGMLALPGGFVEEHETVERAAVRELEEETGIRISEDGLRLIGVFSRIDRDPRQRVISVAYCGEAPIDTVVRAGSDATDAVWLTKKAAIEMGLAFDHAEILRSVGRPSRSGSTKLLT